MALESYSPWYESGSDMHLSGLEKITSLSFSCPICKVEIKITSRAALFDDFTEVIYESTLGHKIRKILLPSFLACFPLSSPLLFKLL